MHPTWTGDLFHTWWYTCLNAILLDHPTLAFSHRVQKSVLYQGFLYLFFSPARGKLLMQNKYVTVIPHYSYLFLGYDFFTTAKMHNSCHIFRSSLLLFYKPNWEIVCIRHSAQQSLNPKNSTKMNQTTCLWRQPQRKRWWMWDPALQTWDMGN